MVRDPRELHELNELKSRFDKSVFEKSALKSLDAGFRRRQKRKKNNSFTIERL